MIKWKPDCRSWKQKRKVNHSQCTFPCFAIGLVLPLLLPTPTIWFSLDHKRNVSDGVVSGIGTLFSLDHKLYASDYNSDSNSNSVASEKQPLSQHIWGRYFRLLTQRLSFFFSWNCSMSLSHGTDQGRFFLCHSKFTHQLPCLFRKRGRLIT